MQSSDLVDTCMGHEAECARRYSECYDFYNKGMIYAAHQLMLKNIDNALDLGGSKASYTRLSSAITRLSLTKVP